MQPRHACTVPQPGPSCITPDGMRVMRRLLTPGRMCGIRVRHEPTSRVSPDAGAGLERRGLRCRALGPDPSRSHDSGARTASGRPRSARTTAPADAGGPHDRSDADDGGAARHRAGHAQAAAPRAGAGQGRRLRPLVDPARRADHRSDGTEDRRVDDRDLLRSRRRHRREPAAVPRDLPRQHHRHLPRRSRQRGDDGRPPQGVHGLHPRRQGAGGDSRRHRFVPRGPAGRRARAGSGAGHTPADGRRLAAVARVQQDDQRLLQVALELPDPDRGEDRRSGEPDERRVRRVKPRPGARAAAVLDSTRSTRSTKRRRCAPGRTS